MAAKRGSSLFRGVFLAIIILFPSLSHGEQGSVFRFPLFYVPGSLDPVRDNSISTNHIVQQIYDGLVAFDDNLRVVPGLAESWTVSRDGTEYIFRLRRGVFFHDGSELSTADVRASLLRIFRPGEREVPAMLLDRIVGARECREGKASDVEGIRVISGTEISIQLLEPYSPFLAALAIPLTKIAPSSAIDGSEGRLGREPIGTGPFRFESWENDTIILKPNRDYYRGSPALEEVRFIFYPKGDMDRAFQDFLDGRLEGCPIPNTQDAEALRGKGYQVLARPGLSLLFYGMNVQKPPLDNPDVRRAIALGSDRETHIRRDLGGPYVPAFQILPPGMPGYTPDNALLKYAPAEAARLLEKAGFPGGKGLPPLQIASASQSDFARRELALFVEDMAALGVRVSPVFVDSWDSFTKGLQEGLYPLYRYALYADIADPDDFLSTLFEGVSPLNYSRFRDPEVDLLFERARDEQDPVRRISLYRQAEKSILGRAPLVPVLNISTVIAFQGGMKGIELPATGTTYLPLYRVSPSR